MNWEAISAIGQIVGALAVVISLIYLGWGVRSSARATQIASERSLADLGVRFLQHIAEHADLSELYYRGLHDFQSLEGAERMRFSALMGQMFRLYEETYFGQSEGHLALRLWREAEAALRDIYGYPGVQAWWRNRSHWFSEKFVKFVDQIQQTAKPPPGFREAIKDQRSTNRSS